MVYRMRRVEPTRLLAYTGVPLSVQSRAIEAYAVGQMGLDRTNDLAVSGTYLAAMRVDQRLGDVTDLEVSVLREAYEQRPSPLRGDIEALSHQPCRHPDLLSSR
jgi:hypothetical protein